MNDHRLMRIAYYHIPARLASFGDARVWILRFVIEREIDNGPPIAAVRNP